MIVASRVRKKTFLKTLTIFSAIALATALLLSGLDIHFGIVSFWENHGLFFLVFIAIFPRLTLLLSSVASGGIFWWMGWLMAPRLLVAVLATLAYGRTNPILVFLSWLTALSGESSEKYYVYQKQRSGRNHNFDSSIKDVESEVIK